MNQTLAHTHTTSEDMNKLMPFHDLTEKRHDKINIQHQYFVYFHEKISQKDNTIQVST